MGSPNPANFSILCVIYSKISLGRKIKTKILKEFENCVFDKGTETYSTAKTTFSEVKFSSNHTSDDTFGNYSGVQKQGKIQIKFYILRVLLCTY
jgi:hypothetical protein